VPQASSVIALSAELTTAIAIPLVSRTSGTLAATITRHPSALLLNR
jgi:hypothetical protein